VTATALDAPPRSVRPGGEHDVPATPRPAVVELLRRPLVAALVLLLAYASLALVLNDPRGTLGTDTGGKLATLHMMERNGGLDPDVGYWAAAADPSGVLHPLHYTYRVGGKWVNVTTLPMLYAAYPLYRVGGDRAVVLLPMLGALVCACAARALARRLGGGSGWSAFWVVGLASPVVIYALDFWEHTWGLGLVLWGVVLLLDVVERRAGWRAAFGAGALFGAAATMRTEALVYLVAATGCAGLVLLVRERRPGRALLTGCAALAGALGPLVGERLLEQWTIGSDLRGARVAGTAGGAAASLTDRLHEAVTTTLGVGLSGLRPSGELVVGLAVVVLLAAGAWGLSSARRPRVVAGSVAVAVAFAVYLVRVSQGLGFVPGVLAASPFAAVGLVLAWRRGPLRLPATIACLALPVVWLTQFTGGSLPQWGGRYVLVTGALLAVAGCVALHGRPRAFLAVLSVAVLVTGAGLTWLSVRSHTVADGMATIVARHDEVLISRQVHALREGGAFYDSSRHWLTATTDAQLARAVGIARATGAHELALLEDPAARAPRELGGYRRGPTQLVAFVRPDVKVAVVTYRLPN